MPVPATNALGIFQNLVQPQGSPTEVRKASDALRQAAATASPYIAAYYEALKMLPEGDLKKWLSLNAVDFWKNVITLIKGRKYTTGQYKLGERFIDQVQGGNVDQRGVPDDAIPIAQTTFTILFGVRLTTNEDLDAINFGVQQYYQRGEKDDVPREAVERAVFLAQHFYGFDTYNRVQWDMRYFEIYPLVAPIPGLTQGTLYTGELPGGARAVNGIIPVDANSVLKQIVGSDFNPDTGTITTPTGEVITPGAQTGGTVIDNLISYVKSNPLVGALLIGGLGFAATELEEYL